MPELAAFQRDFVGQPALPHPPAAPLRIYRNSALLGAIEALSANFPVTRMILGETIFEGLALAFARALPPESPVLAHYGQGLADWLARQEVTRALPYVRDVARCEELQCQTLHAPDAPVLVPAMLESFSQQQLLAYKPKLHPAARFGWFETPAMAIWQAHRDALVGEIAPQWRATGALFTRPEGNVQGWEIDALGHRLLAGVRLGETLGGAAAAAGNLYPGAAVGESFGMLVALGAFLARPD